MNRGVLEYLLELFRELMVQNKESHSTCCLLAAQFAEHSDTVVSFRPSSTSRRSPLPKDRPGGQGKAPQFLPLLLQSEIIEVTLMSRRLRVDG